MTQMILDSDNIGLPIELQKSEGLKEWLAVNSIIFHYINFYMVSK